jgi:glyoxylase-like metal-dependent hydrolase (beta-lactamase superfamily II)
MPLRITDCVHAIRARFGISPFSVWVYAVADPQRSRLLLVDCGGWGSGRAIARGVQALGYSLPDVAAIAITHWHADHTGGIRELLDASDHPVTIYASAADLDAYLAQKPLPIKIRPSWFIPRGLSIYHRPGPVSQRRGISYVRADQVLDDWGIEVIPTPGHTAGHTAYHVCSDGAMCCGDALLRLGNHLYTLGFHCDLEQMDRAAQKLLGRAFDWLLPAHVAPVRSPVPLSARHNVGGDARGAVRLLVRFTAFKYQATVGVARS